MKLKNNNLIIYLIFIFLIFINSINAINKIFNKGTGDYNDAVNWDPVGVPSINDEAIIKGNQNVFVQQTMAVANSIVVGYNSSSAYLNATYGVQTPKIEIWPGNTALFKISGNPYNDFNYAIDVIDIVTFGILRSVGNFITTGTLIDMYYGSSGWVMQDGIVDAFAIVTDGSQIKTSNVQATFETIVLASSLCFIDQSNFTLSSQKYRFPLTLGSIANITNSNFISNNSVSVDGAATKLLFYNSNIFFPFAKVTLLHKVIDGLFFIHSSNFESYQEMNNGGVSGNHLFAVHANSNATIYLGLSFHQKSAFSLENSWFTSYNFMMLNDNAVALITDSEIYVYGDLFLLNSTSFIVEGSKFYSDGDHRSDNFTMTFLRLWDNSKITFQKGSFGYFNSHVITSGNSTLEILQSTLSIGEQTIFNDNSKVVMVDGSITIDDILFMLNTSSFHVEHSTIQISNATRFMGESVYNINNSIFNIIGDYQDLSTTNNFVTNTNISVTGSFKKYIGTLNIENSNVSVGGEFKSMGRINSINTDYIINGTLRNYADTSSFYIESGGVIILEGQFLIESNSNVTAINSSITIMKGYLAMGENSLLELVNTRLYNSLGQVEVLGDIIVNKGGSLKNDAYFKLRSNVIPVNNAGNEIFTNEGTIDIHGGINGVLINIPLRNQNGILSLSNKTEIVSLISKGGIISLEHSAIIASRADVVLSNSKLHGSGIIEATVSSESGVIGNSTISSLNINGDFNSSGDEFIFTIDGNSTGTIINISKNATINNSTLTIRININILSDKSTVLNSTIINYDNLSGNGFNKITFTTYNPETKEEKELDGCYTSNASNSGKGFALLVSNDSCEDSEPYKSLSTGAIIGIAVGSAAFVAAVGAFIFYKNRVPIKQTMSYRLNQLKLHNQSQTSTP